MARIILVGGIESTYRNGQVLFDMGEEILMLFTRGARTPGWEGVDLVNERDYPFSSRVAKTIVRGDINEHAPEIRRLKPDFIFSLGWQQMFRAEFLSVCPVIGIHESLLPEGAGCVPIANAILHDRPVTGVTLFEVDGGMDTGPIIAQRRGRLDPRTSSSTQLYQEAMALEGSLLQTYLPLLRTGEAPRIPQDPARRTTYGKITWGDWPPDKVRRARVYPYA